jgi:hypothetical protein
MASRSGYTPDRMREIGRLSADQARSSLGRGVFNRLKILACEYRGLVASNGSADASAAIRANSSVDYRWTFSGDGFDEAEIVHVRVDHAASRGVAFPTGWKAALLSLDLPDFVKKHLELARAESRVPGLGCRLLGAPAHATISDSGQRVGTVVTLSGVENVLCAHVAGDQWLSHRGSFDDDRVLAKKPLQEKDLVVEDLAGRGVEQPRKRVRTHLHSGQLRTLIAEFPRDFDALVAVAAFRAEEMRADGRELQTVLFAKQFEPIAWRWAERAWDVTVFLQWTWHCRGTVRTALTSVRLDHLRDLERKLSVPAGLGDADYLLWRTLEQVAAAETATRKAPCLYLGVLLQSGKFEADPSRWIRETHYPDGRRTHADVWFEWQYVTCLGGRPHRVTIRVNNILSTSDKKRSPPSHPLHVSMVGGGFCFDVNFMKHVGRNVHGAIQFKGVCFDGGERPDLRVQVPNGGMDILDEPVFWSLPDGRVVCWPLLTLKDKRADELLEENTHDVYRAIAKEFGPSAEWAGSDDGDDEDERRARCVLYPISWLRLLRGCCFRR